MSPVGWGITPQSSIPRQRVSKPTGITRWGACWVEKRIHTGSLASRLSGVYAQCSKDARDGHLTCSWHKRWEDEAQALRGSP